MKRKLALLLISTALFSISFARLKPAESQATLVFTQATIIDTAGGPNQTDMTVFITGDHITAIKKTDKARVPKGAQVINAKGKFLILGLWDMHVHCNDIRDLPLFIATGITGARVMWDFLMHHAWREDIAKGSLLGPRLNIASPIIDGPTPL